MTAAYQVNIHIDAGTTFVQEFHITNPDRSPRNITGFKFNATASKHPRSIDATRTKTGSPVYKLLPFSTRIVNGEQGIMSIAMTKNITERLTEGKYVYNVTMKDINGNSSVVVSGLCFVDVATPEVAEEVILDGGGPFMSDEANILDGGGARV